ncbi:uncharacterized protein E5676_scaffold106G00320 [Cucumis melo var. makuwa]|uniref:Uncharacterized protein n=1 Tax=Cucumis melo var. makuwa TaxID=1194695 RepID=A0A5D3CJW5_CUCMM|nr:uncharacterized protein E6C27_scaffold288G00320 [Cucumis melo var. makuwa]TYK12101.1 uncharacterized protein E5676_scaffold106G00320 [Cucumis melo var. makuwa]
MLSLISLALKALQLDHVTKKIIDRGYESEGLYLFDHQVPQVVMCHAVPTL